MKPLLSRRQALGGAVAAAAATGLLPEPAAAGPAGSGAGAALIRAGDPRYPVLAERGYNKRFTATPDEIVLVHSAEQVRDAVERAVRAGRRIGIRSGGHSFDGLVDDPAVRVLIDLSAMKRVEYDERLGAVAVDAGLTLGEAYRALFLNWGVTIPGGICPDVGLGGHVAGGGYGPLSRRHGLVVDHLHAVEVVVVDAAGRARIVVATRRPDDPNHDLWWAHTGGGGGSLGVVTRYWFRSPGAQGGDPGRILPRPPQEVLQRTVTWSWAQLAAEDLPVILRNHGRWHAANAGSAGPYADLYSALSAYQRLVSPQYTTSVELSMQIDAAVPDAAGLLDAYCAAVRAGVGSAPVTGTTTSRWLTAALAFDPGPGARTKSKGAYLRAPWDDRQLAAVCDHLTRPVGRGLLVTTAYSYGGRVNDVAPGATAVAQRDSVLKAWFAAFWPDASGDAESLAAIRRFYADVHAADGGVPRPGPVTDGCYINYADMDLADPALNTSGVPWSTLYHKDGYPRLQAVKQRYDPRDVFRHALSIRLPG
ncbi:FAD-binding protein [Dactylosporangium sp. AC04546]|uniref:FAD-binding oxidoreductase n=1 Tax=Dactylosporangium sp. AC04546 TaxID=2862460 RepID=UPI001EE0783E|nr:FAD-binding protein [Dactylosporangium sp. AC04546]WVK79046.1 FAD-binding protein [Dactylosporangium sp. AC04546]